MQAKPNKQVHPFKKVTPEKIEAILKDIAEGSPKKYAAESNGITESHFYYLIKQGIVDLDQDLHDTLHAKLVVSLRKIEQKEIIWCRKQIRKEKKGHKGAEWVLERAYWRTFGSNAQTKELADEIEQFRRDLKGAKQDGNEDEEKEGSQE